jgi:hypothetical protein
MHLLELGPSLFGAPGAQIGQHGLRVIVQDHADKLIQSMIGSDVDFWGAFEKVTQASSAFIVNVRIDQFDRNTFSEEKSASELKRVVLPPPPLAPSVNMICLRSACFLSVVFSILGLVFEGFVRVIAQVPFLGFLFLGARLSASACGFNG